MLHRLTEWEDNGYNDSDFWVSVYDDETNTLRSVLSGSTRFAGYAPGQGPDLGEPISDPQTLQKALRALAEHIHDLLSKAEHHDVYEPDHVERGATVRLLRTCKHKGTVGHEGAVGKVFWSGAYGQFFRKGYNKPGRENTRVGIELADGTTAFVALSACRLNREPEDDEELGIRAWELAQNCEFSKATREKHAWDSLNFAKALYLKTYGAEALAA